MDNDKPFHSAQVYAMSDMEILFHVKTNKARVFVFGRTSKFSIENMRFRLFLELQMKDFVDRYRVLL